MNRVNAIINHPVFIDVLGKIASVEHDRPFCCHDLQHLLDTARIAYILALESGADIGKELIYTAALLHDTGRYLQYTEGVPHEVASAGIAAEILPECGFCEDETALIIAAISAHRRKNEDMTGLSGLLYRADKLSRACYNCAARRECNWADERKNMKPEY